MSSLPVRLVIGAGFLVAVAMSCSSSDDKKAVSRDSEAGAAGEQPMSSGGTRAGSNAGGRPNGGSADTTEGGSGAAGSFNDGGAEGQAAAGQGGEGAASGRGGAAGEGGVLGLGGDGGGAGDTSGGCCDPQVNYSAANGVLPTDDACDPWALTDTAALEEPTFVGDALRVASSSDAEHMYFIHNDENLSFPDMFVFEARMKLVSGAGSSSSRAPASMAFVYGAQHMKNMLQMSATEVFI